MAKDNIYDRVIGELVIRSAQNVSSLGPSLVLNSDLPTGNLVTYNSAFSFSLTSEVRNIPTGYTVKSSTHIISYPGGAPASDVSSLATFTGSQVVVMSGSTGWTYTVSVTVTLEKSGSADLVLSDTFIFEAVTTLYYKKDSVDNNFVLTSTSKAILDTTYGSDIVWSVNNSNLVYLYIIVPTGTSVSHLVDHNQDIIFLTDFTVSTVGGYDYYVSNWATNFNISFTHNWKVIFN